eukprot:CAMPEP_0119548944 /NCGR_PEP_ID=MMETSP1352-20130426/2745_1 /TAXON_ID=265584 /ORGANISM="Stauroneis constricta, Strain CCMP1120" /LENGTH=880 /DNA_ID=CAMNT_0007594355 /DNA_START=53 /DNA_END=2695 /DNA_ORIENTATION=+
MIAADEVCPQSGGRRDQLHRPPSQHSGRGSVAAGVAAAGAANRVTTPTYDNSVPSSYGIDTKCMPYATMVTEDPLKYLPNSSSMWEEERNSRRYRYVVPSPSVLRMRGSGRHSYPPTMANAWAPPVVQQRPTAANSMPTQAQRSREHVLEGEEDMNDASSTGTGAGSRSSTTTTTSNKHAAGSTSAASNGTFLLCPQPTHETARLISNDGSTTATATSASSRAGDVSSSGNLNALAWYPRGYHYHHHSESMPSSSSNPHETAIADGNWRSVVSANFPSYPTSSSSSAVNSTTPGGTACDPLPWSSLAHVFDDDDGGGDDDHGESLHDHADPSTISSGANRTGGLAKVTPTPQHSDKSSGSGNQYGNNYNHHCNSWIPGYYSSSANDNALRACAVTDPQQQCTVVAKHDQARASEDEKKYGTAAAPRNPAAYGATTQHEYRSSPDSAMQSGAYGNVNGNGRYHQELRTLPCAYRRIDHQDPSSPAPWSVPDTLSKHRSEGIDSRDGGRTPDFYSRVSHETVASRSPNITAMTTTEPHSDRVSQDSAAASGARRGTSSVHTTASSMDPSVPAEQLRAAYYSDFIAGEEEANAHDHDTKALGFLFEGASSHKDGNAEEEDAGQRGNTTKQSRTQSQSQRSDSTMVGSPCRERGKTLASLSHHKHTSKESPSSRQAAGSKRRGGSQQEGSANPCPKSKRQRRSSASSSTSSSSSSSSTSSTTSAEAAPDAVPSRSTMISTRSSRTRGGHGSRKSGSTAARKPKTEPSAAAEIVKPLSAYNFFFAEERGRIVDGTEDLPRDDVPQSTRKERLLWHHVNKDRKKRRIHRKTHGKIAFTTLSKVIGKRWRELPNSEKDFFREVAKADLERYQDQMEKARDRASRGHN